MARTKKHGPKVVPLSEPPAKADEQPQAAQPAESEEQKPESKPRERKRVISFYDNVRKIPAVEWGKRAYIYGYCLEPVCNIKAFGENKYLFKSGSPNIDEDQMMKDYGSGRYRLNLVYRKAAADQGDEMDNVELEIYNPKYPPKIPRSVWQNDPRNERWAALLPPEVVPQPATPLGNVAEAFRTFTEMRKDLREELAPPPAPPKDTGGSDIDRFTSMVTAVKNILPQPAPPTENTMLNTIVALLTAQVQASEKKAEQLQSQIFQMLQKQAEKPQQNGTGQIKEIVQGLKDLAPSIKDLIPGVEGLRAGKTTWLDIAREAAPSVMDAFTRITVAIASRPAPLAPGQQPPMYQGNPALPPANGAPPPVAPQAGQQTAAQPQQMPIEQKVWAFLQMQATPLMNYFRGFCQGTNEPSDFAEWVDDGYPPDPAGNSPLKDARGLGRDRIIAMFKGSPAWPAIAPMEGKLVEFVDGVLGWQPEPELPDAQGDDEHIDMTAAGGPLV